MSRRDKPDASGTGNGTPSGKGGKTPARKAAEDKFAKRQEVVRKAQEKHGGKSGKDK